MKKFSRSLFIFRRDLRIDDNSGLIAALAESDEVLPLFIFDKRLVAGKHKHLNAIQFMIGCLADLEDQLKARRGRLIMIKPQIPEEFIKTRLKSLKVEAVFVNRDYTPFSIKRDEAIKQACEDIGVKFYSFDDALLNPPELVLKDDGSTYSVFTPYWRKAATLTVSLPRENSAENYASDKLDFEISLSDAKSEILAGYFNSEIATEPGSKGARGILKNIKSFKSYSKDRDLPGLSATTRLSAHNKFGTVSARRVYHLVKKYLGSDHPLIKQYYWRDFFTYIAYHSPHVFKGAFHEKFNKIRWGNDPKLFDAWKEGRTGFPMVDAGMRELKRTGYMHNRARMVVASFLVKDLHIDWRWGERYFAENLIDYDPAVNNGNWQWVASTGCDAQPYFRVFNPDLQLKRFDPEYVYVKKWVEEFGTERYAEPIVDHKQSKEIALRMFREITV